MAEQPQIVFDEKSGKVVELVKQEVQDDFQTRFDEAQNRLNTANDAVNARQAEYDEAVNQVEAKSVQLDEARKEVEAAQEEVDFQTARKAQYDEAVRLRGEVAESGDAGEDASGDENGESEAVDIPVHAAEAANF